MNERYQGALVEIFNTGVFRNNIVKLDLKSMYPSIMIALNLSPESCHFIERKEHTGQYTITPDLVEVPDKMLGQVIVRIDQEDSISRQELLNLMAERENVRARTDLTPQEKESMQLAIKVIMNALYGYNGLEFSRYGSFLVAIITTAIGRLMMQTMIDECNKIEGIVLIEADTDGLMIQNNSDKDIKTIMNDKIQALFSNFVHQKNIRIDTDNYDGVISCKMKNYVMLHKDEVIFKGASFHGRHIPMICDKYLVMLARDIFKGKSDTPIPELSALDIEDFVMTVELKKDPSAYKLATSLYSKLAKQVKGVEWGDEIRYVKTDKSYVPLGSLPEAELKPILDFDYYKKRIDTMAVRLQEVLPGYVKPEKKRRKKKVTLDGD